HGQDGSQVFGGPVFVGGRLGCRDDVASAGAPAQFDAMGGEGRGNARQDGHGDAGIDQQRFHGAADAVAVSLGVECDGKRFFGVGGRVDVHVAVAVEVLDERHAGFVGQARDQAFSAARHDDVDVFRHGDELAYRGAVGGVDDLYGLGRQG